MEFGFGMPTRGAVATPESMATLAKQGENLGFGIISVSDHLIIPKAIASTYPYNESGSFVSSPSGECMEQLTLLTFLAGVTSTAKLLTSVMVVRHMMVNLQGDTLEQTLGRMQRFADRIMPLTA